MEKHFSAFLLFAYLITYSQKNISAKVDIDKYANLHISEYLNLSKKEDTLTINKNILIHSKYAELLGDGSAGSILYKAKTDSLLYVLNPPSKKNNNEFHANNDFFFTTLEYLALPKKEMDVRKKFNLEFNSPHYKIIYPDSEDLKKEFRTAPPLAGGNFVQINEEGFTIYYLKKDTQYIDRIKLVSDDLVKAHRFYSNYFGENIKPKIIYVPFIGDLYGRTFEDVIFFNTNLYSTDSGSKRLAAHEMAHIWFGDGSLSFESRRMTEGTADFMALEYLKSIDDKEYLNTMLGQRFYGAEGFTSFEKIFEEWKSGKDNFNISYSLIPIVMYMRQKNDPDFINQLSEFYKLNKAKRKISVNELEEFLLSKGKKKLFPEGNLPDFFIMDQGEGKVAIISASDKNYTVEIQKTFNDGKTERQKLKFSKNKSQYTIPTEKIKKILIDPEFNILQGTRLNDTWTKNNDNLLSRNFYFDYEKLNPKVADISNQIIDFLKGNNMEASSKLVFQNENDKKKLITIKKEHFNSEDIILTGASSQLASKNKMITLLISYYDKKKNISNVLTFNIATDSEISMIRKIYISDTESVENEESN